MTIQPPFTWPPAARQHRRARCRCPFPPQRSPRSLTDRAVMLLWPWRQCEYPGQTRMLAAILAIASETARQIRAGRHPLPSGHAFQLATYLRMHAAECLALAAEAEAHAVWREASHPRSLCNR